MVSKVFLNYFDIKEMILFIHSRLCRSDVLGEMAKRQHSCDTLSNLNHVLSVFSFSFFFYISAFAARFANTSVGGQINRCDISFFLDRFCTLPSSINAINCFDYFILFNFVRGCNKDPADIERNGLL